MEDDLEWLGVGRENDQVGEAAIEGLGRLVGALLQLYHLTNGEDQVSILSLFPIKRLPPCHQ